MYELEIAIESQVTKRNELIKLHNGYMSECDVKKQNHMVSRLGNLFLIWLFYLE